MNLRELLKVSGPAVVVGSLCCLSPVILVLFGASLSSFGVTLFLKTLGPYEWVFQLSGMVLLVSSVTYYLRGRGICTLDQVRARRNEVINVTLLALIASSVGYAVWFFGIVNYVGYALHLWV